MFFKRYFLTLTLVPLLLITATATYYRFVVLKNYDITYEVECDPYMENCFASCEERACEDPFYYKYITKHASDLSQLCGEDITDCPAAATCKEGQISCKVTYCFDDPQGCEDLDAEDKDSKDTEFFQEIQNLMNNV